MGVSQAPDQEEHDEDQGQRDGFYTFNGESLVTFTEDSRQETFVNFLYEVRKSNVCDHLILILDNFSTHKSELVKATARMLGITLVYLPPYSPELNPIEEVWKNIRRELSTFIVSNVLSSKPKL